MLQPSREEAAAGVRLQGGGQPSGGGGGARPSREEVSGCGWLSGNGRGSPVESCSGGIVDLGAARDEERAGLAAGFLREKLG